MDRRTIFFVILLAVSFYVMQFIFKPPQKQAQTTSIKQEKVVEPKAIEAPSQVRRSITQQSKDQKFYVIENDFQQLVFSSVGGSLAEINLSLRSKANQKSVINEINFDRELKAESRPNAMFPLHSYSKFENGRIVTKEGTLGGYYPLIRRELIGIDEKISPTLYALNIISDNEDIENANYDLVRLEKDLIEFEIILPNRRIVKTYTFAKEAPYTFDTKISIEGDSKHLWLTSGVPEVELTSGRYAPMLKLRTYRKQKNVVEKLSLPKTQITVSSTNPDWICNSNGFLGLIIDPLTEISPGYRSKYISGQSFPSRLTLIDPKYNPYPANKYPGYEMFLPLSSDGKTTTFRVLAAPFAKDILKAVDATYSNAITGYNPDYVAAQSFHGIFAFISEPFAKLMFSLMQLFHKTTHSWGFSIILLTLVLRVMLYPLNAWTIKSQMRMQELAPQMKAIQKKHAKNPQKAKMEVMNLYREKGANPLMGCFPLLIQLPFLIGMFDLLKSTFELRGVPFVPGWIDSLTSPDIVFSWNMPIPLIGTEFHLLPIIMGVVMFLQTKFTSKAPKDPTQMTDQQRQQKALSTIMPIVFTVIFYKMPSGLNIYYLFFSLFGILQQWIMNKTNKKKLLKA